MFTFISGRVRGQGRIIGGSDAKKGKFFNYFLPIERVKRECEREKGSKSGRE